jgi:hypothetical protein
MKTLKDFNLEKEEKIEKEYPIVTYDEYWNTLTFKNSDWYWREYTRDENWRVLTFKDSDGYWEEYTRDECWNELTYKDSNWYWNEYTYDENWKVLTFKNSYWYLREKRKEWLLEYDKSKDQYKLNWEVYILKD